MPLTVKRHKRNKVTKITNKKRIRKQRSKYPKTTIPQLSRIWDNHKSAAKNLSDMGLSSDPNLAVSRPFKLNRDTRKKNGDPLKELVAETLEAEAKAPRVVKFKFPTPQAMHYSYLIEKYGDDFKAMAKDPKNVYQDTWKHIRSKIRQFKKLGQYHKMVGRK